MAEEDVSYSTIVFKNKNSSSPADKKEEETVYAEVNVANEATEQSDGKTVSTDKKRNSQCRRLICCLGILCVILLLSLIAVVVNVVIDHMSKETQESLLAANQNLTDFNNKLSSENENLRRDNNNLTQSFAALENKTSSLTVKNKLLKGQNQELKGQNQELKGQNDNLTRKNQDLEAKWNELNVSRAQWSVDAYCLKKDNRQCKPCERGWEHSQSSCYAINNAQPDEQRSWDGAREDCRGKISDLVVIASQEEKKVVNDHSWPGRGIKGYWIGLRVEDMKWQWVDGSNLTEASWMDPSTNGYCAISVKGQGLKLVNCSDRNAWICEKRSLVL